MLGVTSALAVKYNESPMLRVKVAAGELPPIEERLPEDPIVIQPIEKIGQYGGTARVLSAVYAGAPGDGVYFQGMEPLVRIDQDFKTMVPNVAKKWEFSEGGKTLTLYLRKIKWSDGVPFTADDIMFWYEDIVLNDELTPIKPGWFTVEGELGTVEKVDNHTVRFRFAVPYPTVMLSLAHYVGMTPITQPKHYLKQFHTKYNPKADELAKEHGFDFWYQYFGNRSKSNWGMPMQPDLPGIYAFRLVKEHVDTLWFERNPYYWKVDPEGNQLPYIDGFITTWVGNVEVYNAKIIAGEADFALRSTSLANYSLYKENEKKGDYRVLLWPGVYGGAPRYNLNLTDKDPVLRGLFQDVRLRRAVSLAINREEINDTLWFGKAEPCQFTVIPEALYYEPEFAKSFAEYDLEKANQLLDEMGLKWDKNHEYRLRPDGEKLRWVLEYNVLVWGELVTKTNEMVKEYLKEIGIQLVIKEISGELQWVRAPSNDISMGLWSGDRAADPLFTTEPYGFLPMRLGGEATMAPEWARWYLTQGKEGEEPPEEIKKLYQWWEKMQLTMDEKERIELGKKICASQAENLWSIGTVGMPPMPVLVKNDLRNVPERMPYGWAFLYTAWIPPAQFFFEQK